jgi:hypothetical protein
MLSEMLHVAILVVAGLRNILSQSFEEEEEEEG